MGKIKVHALDVGHGDAVIISLKNEKCVRNILIDGGKATRGPNKINEKLKEVKSLDGIIVTHVDNDHIGGVLNFIKDINDTKDKLKKREKLFFLEEVKEFFVIFNKFDDNLISYKQGRTLQDQLISFKKALRLFYGKKCKLLKSYDIAKEIVLDGESPGIPIIIHSVSTRSKVDLIDNSKAYITILTPSKEDVIKNMVNWNECEINNKKSNAEIINKASISFLLEYADKKVLISGDAYIKDILNNLELIGRDKISKIDLIKLPHHGSYENNIRLKELLNNYNCEKVFVCADGSYNLPDKRVIEELDCEIACTSKLKEDYLKIAKKNKYTLN